MVTLSVWTLEKANVYLLLKAVRGHKALPLCNSLWWKKQDVVISD